MLQKHRGRRNTEDTEDAEKAEDTEKAENTEKAEFRDGCNCKTIITMRMKNLCQSI